MIKLELWHSGGNPDGPFVVEQRFASLSDALIFIHELDHRFNTFDWARSLPPVTDPLAHYEGSDVYATDETTKFQWYLDEDDNWIPA